MRAVLSTFLLFTALASQCANAATTPPSSDVASYAETLLANSYRTDAPGLAVLVMRGDEVLYRGARGLADVEAGIPLTPDDHFRIGSVTKQIAAAGLLTLVDAGKVGLDDPLSKYLPGYPDGARITVEQLLNHTSGIKSYTELPAIRQAHIKRDLTTLQLIDHFRNETPDFAPGAGWGYNNSGYVLVGAIIEVASGQPWHRYLEHALFTPLGMKDTGYGADPVVSAREVRGYITRGNVPRAPLPVRMTQPHAAGALVSTVDDLARWNRALHEGGVLKPATYARMVTSVGKASDVGYGYGIWSGSVRGAPALEHSGGIHGFDAHLTYLPGPGITVAVLRNSETQETQLIARRLAAMALGDPYPPLKPVVVDAAVLKQYEGVYRVDPRATRSLRVADGRLTVQRTDGPREPLTAIADDTFVYPDGFNSLRMERDASGEVTGMRFFSDGEGDGIVAQREAQRPWGVTAMLAALALLVAGLLVRRVTRNRSPLQRHPNGRR